MNLSEQDAAEIMRIEDTNPVAMYATSGLETIVHMHNFGLLPSRQAVYANDVINRHRMGPSGVLFSTTVLLPESEMGSFNLSQEIEDPYVIL
jgi:hypothetical protein